MLAAGQNTVDLTIAISVFGLVLALWLVGVFLWAAGRLSSMRHVHGRLGLAGHKAGEDRVLRLWKEGEEATTRVPDQGRPSVLEQIQQLCREANLEMPAQTLLLATLGGTALVFLVVFTLTDSAPAGLAISVALLLLLWAYLKGRIKRRVLLLESQLVEALELAARSLRAGHPLVGAFHLVADEMPAPISTVFAEICQLQALGLSLEDAIHRSAATSGSADMKLFATSVVIQVRTGGNLADMMTRLAFVIRDRMKLMRRVRILTAQTQLSKRVLTALPFVLFVVLNLVRPGYMVPLYTTPAGWYLMTLAASGVLLGVWMMNRLSVLRY